jgi:hypothetical protein
MMKSFLLSRTAYFVVPALVFMAVHAWAGGEVTLKGILEVDEEDADYRPLTMNLVVDDLSGKTVKSVYYLIDNQKGKGKELLEFETIEVVVTGTVKKLKSGKLLTVSKWRRAGDPEPKEEKPAEKKEASEDAEDEGGEEDAGAGDEADAEADESGEDAAEEE